MARAKPATLHRDMVTPEGVNLGVDLAEVGSRAAALLLDLLMMGAVLVILSLVAIFGIFGVGPSAWPSIAIIWLLGFFLLRNAYFIGFELGARAATPGKRRMGLRVIARDGGRLTADRIVARNLLREAELFMPMTLAISQGGEGADAAMNLLAFCWTALFLLFPLFNRDRLRVGDLLAGTWVVRNPRRALAVDLADTRTVRRHSFTSAQLDAYGVYELQTLEDVLRKGEEGAIWTVAHAIEARIGWTGGMPDARAFLNDYYAALRARLERGVLLGKRRETKAG